MAQDNEASVEEILESIKKVIARDNRVGALEARRRRMLVPEDTATDTDTDAQTGAAHDPLLHTHIVRNAPDSPQEVLDLADMECAPGTADPSDDDSFGEDMALPLGQTADESPLIADALRDSMQENLAALAMMAQPPARPQIVRSGETSLEGLTRELLRPMLAQWLEANLPAMVESLVQAEIARIVGKRR